MKRKNEWCNLLFKNFQFLLMVLFSLVLLLSCTKTNNTNLYKYGLVEYDSLLVIPITSDISTNSRHLQFFETNENQKLLAYASSNSLLFFNIDSLNLYKHVRFEPYGPDGIGNLRGFHVISPDSILIVNQFAITLFNSEPKRLKKVELHSLKDNLHNLLSPSNRNYNPVVRVQDRFYFSTFMFDLDKNDYANSSVGICYDIKVDSLFELPVNYPKFSGDYDSRGHYYSRIFHDDKWLYSFAFLDDIYVKKESGAYELIYAPSLLRSKEKLYYKEGINGSSLQIVRNPKYLSLTYDPWQNVFYRFFYPGFSAPEGEDEEFYDSLLDTPTSFSVIVLNAHLEIIGETIMPFQMYDPGSYFVNEYGLFMALHVNHPEFDSDCLKYARFTVEP